jgi:hypothetical protein
VSWGEYEKRSNFAQSQIGSVNKTGSLPFGVREKQKAQRIFRTEGLKELPLAMFPFRSLFALA